MVLLDWEANFEMVNREGLMIALGNMGVDTNYKSNRTPLRTHRIHCRN